VLHLKSKLFWNGVGDDGGRPAIVHDILIKLHCIEFGEEHFEGYQIYVVIKTNCVSIITCGEWFFQFLLRYCIMLGIDKFTTILIVVLE
jgi:hypothetical protein